MTTPLDNAAAAGASVAGRVFSRGRTSINAVVTLTGTGGVTRTVQTNSFGYFIFSEVESGATYINNVAAKQNTFAPQVVTVTSKVAGLTFNAL